MSTLTHPNHIAAYTLATQRAALRMEKIGLKSRFGALRPRLAAGLGLKPRDSYDVFIAELTRRIEELKQGA